MDAPEGDKAEPLTETAESGRSTAPAPESSTRSSIAITVLAVGGSAVGNLLAYKIITMLGSPEVFTAYSTERRYLSFLLPLLMLGAGVSLPLRVSIRPDEQESVRILYGQLAVSSLFAGLLLVTFIVLPPSVLLAFAPDTSRTQWAALIFATSALNATTMLYALDRGYQNFGRGAVVMILGNGVFPCLAALLVARGVAATFVVWGVLCLLLTVVMLRRLPPLTRGAVWQRAALIRFSLARVPGDFAYGALFLVPVAHFSVVDDPLERSVFNYFFVLLGLLTALASPISTVLLPVVGSLVSRQGHQAARRLWASSLFVGGAIGGLTALGLAVFGSLVVETLMAPEYVRAAGLLGQMWPAVVGLAIFLFLRSIVDGMGERPVTSLICLASVAVYAAMWWARGSAGAAERVMDATNASLGFLGGVIVVITAAAFLAPLRRRSGEPAA